MSSTITTRLDAPDEDPGDGSAGVARSEPGGRAQRRAGAARRSDPRPELAERVKELLPDGVIDELLAGASTEEEIAGQGGLLGQLTKRLVERAMEVELTDHLGYETHAEPPGGSGNTGNGSTPKRLITESGEVAVNTPRDRDGSFEPKIVKKRQRRFEGFDDKILALYAREVDPGYLGSPAGDRRRQGRPRSHQQGDRRCARGREGVADASAG